MLRMACSVVIQYFTVRPPFVDAWGGRMRGVVVKRLILSGYNTQIYFARDGGMLSSSFPVSKRCIDGTVCSRAL